MNDTVMNWWAHQGSARARTRRLVMMISAVLATALMIYVILVAFRLIFYGFFSVVGFVYDLFNLDKGSPPALGDAHALWWPLGLSPEEGEGNFFLGLPVALVGLLGALAALFIQVRICRQREYLADACAVQYTRYAPALAEALRAIEANPGKSWMKHSASHELAHMFFADTKRRWIPFFRTHPKTTKRIGRIEPTRGR